MFSKITSLDKLEDILSIPCSIRLTDPYIDKFLAAHEQSSLDAHDKLWSLAMSGK